MKEFFLQLNFSLHIDFNMCAPLMELNVVYMKHNACDLKNRFGERKQD